MLLLLLQLCAAPAFAAESRDFGTYLPGDRFEWTTYGLDHSKPNFGHRFEWRTDGMSRVSVCNEVDAETGGHFFRQFVDEVHCPVITDVEHRWDVPLEGMPSRCLEVDSLTQGERFSRVVALEACAKPPTVYLREQTSNATAKVCYEVDEKTRGKVYRQVRPDYRCVYQLGQNPAASEYRARRAPASPRGN